MRWRSWRHSRNSTGRPTSTSSETARRTLLSAGIAILQNAAAPAHRHGPGEEYGERIGTFFGAIEDVTDDGRPIEVGPDDVLYHAPGSLHQPRAKFWFGYYHQPRGSELIGPNHPDFELVRGHRA